MLFKVEMTVNIPSSLPQVNATSSDGRCAPYCLTSFFELLHSTIDSYDAD
jgi:hypothetical protein